MNDFNYFDDFDSELESVYPDPELVHNLGLFHYHTAGTVAALAGGPTSGPACVPAYAQPPTSGPSPASVPSNALPVAVAPAAVASADFTDPDPNCDLQPLAYRNINPTSTFPTPATFSSSFIDPQILFAYDQLLQQQQQPLSGLLAPTSTPSAISPFPPPPPPPFPTQSPSPANEAMPSHQSPFVDTSGDGVVYYCEADGCESGPGGKGFRDYEAYKKHVASYRDLNNHRAAYHYCPLPHPKKGTGHACPKFISINKRLDEIHRHFKKDHSLAHPSHTADRRRHRDRMVEVAVEACRAEGHEYVPYKKQRKAN
ncbi:hypothetical protein ACRALDRAFT_1067938 [Sodiomyces alcalophilus JCM 7366]|uniref:uncharacterized protein n=1 Tax=Sodiomyces alcalophilus JCM 7366 TaxID=591952 RepID=UPI0039B4F40B